MKQTNKLNERNIYNDYEIANLGDKLFITYDRNGGRACLPSWWAVNYCDRAFKNEPWYTHGSKIFSANNSRDTKSLYKALLFASKINQCKEWVKTPFGGYVSKFTADKVGLKYKEKNIITINQEEE